MTGMTYTAGSPQIIDLPWVSSVTQYGITWTFAAPRPAGQYANGDWWVIGPVTISSTSPASAVISGTYVDGTAYSGRKTHGMMVNPGNRSFATGGLKANNANNANQGWDSLPPKAGYAGGTSAQYTDAWNVDPGNTGVPLTVTTGSLVKVISQTNPANINTAGQAILTDMAVLTVTDEIPPYDALRPGIAWTDKRHIFRMKHFDLSVFQNFAPTATAPTAAAAAALVARMFEVSQPDAINSRNIHATNNHPEYGREIAANVSTAALALHLNFTEAEKRQILYGLGQIGVDCWARAFEGAFVPGYGGGNTWKKVPLVMIAAALGSKAAAASMVQYADKTLNHVFAEDRHVFRVTATDVAIPRYTADGRPRTAYARYMIGSAEWSESPIEQPNRGGSNWNATYRDVAWGKMMGGSLAVQLTTGAQTLWNSAEFFTYTDNAWDRYSEFLAPTNQPGLFHQEMWAAHKVAPVGAAAVLTAEVKDTVVYATFNQALDEGIAAPATSDFVVNVNGAPVAKTGVVQVWRQNIGLTLSAAVTGNDVVTISYTPGTNKLKNVYGTDVAAFANRETVNKTDKVGGPNAAYPVIQFSADSVYTIGGAAKFAAADSRYGTIVLKGFRLNSVGTGAEYIGTPSGGELLSLIVGSTNIVTFRLYDAAGTTLFRGSIPALTVGVDYDIMLSIDVEQATAGAGVDAYVNGSSVAITVLTWAGGAGKTLGWSRPVGTSIGRADFRLGALWLDATARLDITNGANRAKFTNITSGNLDILTLGNGITGSQPALFLVGNADQWNNPEGVNRGAGDKFAYTSGTMVTLVSGAEWV